MIAVFGAFITILSFVFAYFSFKRYGDVKDSAGFKKISVSLTRTLAALAAGLGIIIMLGLFSSKTQTGNLKWNTNIEQALQDAAKQHKPVIIDAWAKWCPACKELGENTLTDPKVKKALKGFVRVKFDMTDFDPAHAHLKKLGHDVKNLPSVLFIRPSGKAWKCRVNDYIKPERFVQYVDAFGHNLGNCPQKTGLLQHGFWIAILIAFAAGFGVSLTPCVFPVLPGVAGILSGWPMEKLSLRIRIKRSLLFVTGMAMIYTGLGLASGLLGWGFGSMMSNPRVTGLIAVIFALLALSYLGLFSTNLPGPIKNTLSKVRESDPGIFLMGGGIGLVAAPCSGPVTVAILAYIASAGGPVSGSILMFAFAIGMGTLFFIMGVFSSLLERIPSRGLASVMIEFTFAVALFASAIYYVLLTI